MGTYQTVVVGTDGSDSPLRAVERAAAIAAEDGAKLIIAPADCSYRSPPKSPAKPRRTS
ncbi:universal stress protein family protein [Mycobacterium lentiflavum]|uniref:Universal stress protein family protein n=1 Tax=Mycobacterium lentiflavum TaxID=141349 RepID=A0A0E4GZL1_MYCLN|nr:universal stress protein family protein [Mycobacterium lentiflavum]